MSEDRTQAPSKLRRQQAREQGHVAQSRELTAAAGLLGATAALGAFGGSLVTALLALLSAPFADGLPVTTTPALVIAALRNAIVAVAVPLALIAASAAGAALLAHQAQVLGLWAPALLAPDPGRLWSAGRGPGVGARGRRGLWGWLKALVVIAVFALTLSTSGRSLQRLGDMPVAEVARASGQALFRLTATLSITAVVLGLIDFALEFHRVELLLRVTPEEHREDQKSIEGDPALRARRRRLARIWRGDGPELVAGASALLAGSAGLTLVLTGGPPPRPLNVRAGLQGASGTRLRQSAAAAKLPVIDAPELAGRLARLHAASRPIPAEAVAELASLWPIADASPAPGRGPNGPRPLSSR